LFRTGGTRGVRPSEGFPSDRRGVSRRPLPLLTFLVDHRAPGDVARAPGRCCEGPSSLRCPRRRTPSLTAWKVVVASCARTWPVSSAPPGVSARIGSPYSGRRVLPRTMGADPLLGFSALQGFPPPRLDVADAASPLVRFVAVCEQAAHGRSRVSIGGEVGWSLSRLPPLLGFLSSSREPSSGLRPSDGPGETQTLMISREVAG
jgi:hypothetical protein